MKEAMCCYCFNTIEYERGAKPEVCPECGTGYWKKPRTEERCFLLQRDYIKYRKVDIERSERALGDLYYLLEEYAIGTIKKMLKGKKILPEDTLQEYGAEAAFTFIKKYLESAEEENFFVIDKSFGGQLRFILLPILHGQKIIFQDSILSLNSHIEEKDKKEKMELNNFENLLGTDIDVEFYLQEQKEESAIESITRIIETVRKEVYDKYGFLNSIFYLTGVYHKINNAHLDFMDRYYETHGGVVVQSVVEFAMNEIKEFIEQES